MDDIPKFKPHTPSGAAKHPQAPVRTKEKADLPNDAFKIAAKLPAEARPKQSHHTKTLEKRAPQDPENEPQHKRLRVTPGATQFKPRVRINLDANKVHHLEDQPDERKLTRSALFSMARNMHQAKTGQITENLKGPSVNQTVGLTESNVLAIFSYDSLVKDSHITATEIAETLNRYDSHLGNRIRSIQDELSADSFTQGLGESSNKKEFILNAAQVHENNKFEFIKTNLSLIMSINSLETAELGTILGNTSMSNTNQTRGQVLDALLDANETLKARFDDTTDGLSSTNFSTLLSIVEDKLGAIEKLTTRPQARDSA